MSGLNGLLEAVADAKETDPGDVDIVLEHHVSTDAIRNLDEHDSDSWMLQFELPSHTVRIEADDTILVDGTEHGTFA